MPRMLLHHHAAQDCSMQPLAAGHAGCSSMHPAAAFSHHRWSLLCSMQVQKHMDLMQQQKETAAMDKLRQLMPQMGDMVRALALSKADWDIDQAVSTLRSFQVSHLDKVNMLNKVSAGKWIGAGAANSLAGAACWYRLPTAVCFQPAEG